MNLNQPKNIIVFKDKKQKNGKRYDWRGLKRLTIKLSDSYMRLDNDRKMLRTWECASMLDFLKCTNTGDLKLQGGNFCQIRLCPMCAKRRSLKIFGQTSKIMAEIQNDYKFLFLTLTVKNVKSEDLEETIKHMSRSFNRLFKYKAVEGITEGFFRALEITYNEETDEYHPHYHVIMAVPPNYARLKDGAYLRQEEFTKLWKKALKIDYTPVVHITRFGKDKRIDKAVAETAKYTVKSGDYLKASDELTDKIVGTLDKALEYKRLIGMGGIFKEIHAKLNLDDATDGDLVNTDNEEAEKFENYIVLKVKWSVGFNNYLIDDFIEM